MYYDKNDNENKTSNRLKKIAIAATGIGVAAFSLKETGSLKYLSKAVNTFGETAYGIKKDFSKLAFKDIDEAHLKDIFKRRIFDHDSIFNLASTFNLARAKKVITDIDQSEGLLASLKKLSELKNKFGDNILKNKISDNIHSNLIMDEIHKKYKNESEEFFQQARVFTNRVLNEKHQFFEEEDNIYKSIKEEFDNVLKGGILEKHSSEFSNIIETALNSSEEFIKQMHEEVDSSLKPQLIEKFKEEIISKYSKEPDFFKSTVDNAAKVKDYINAYEDREHRFLEDNEQTKKIYDLLKNLVSEDKRFEDLYIDKFTLRVDKNGGLYSSKALNDLKDSIEKELSSTIFGKLFGLQSHILDKSAPDFYYIGQGTYDKVLAELTGDELEKGILKHDYFKLGDNIYKYEDSVLSKIDEASNLYLMGTKNGPLAKALNILAGNTYVNPVENSAAKFFDIGTTGVTKWRKKLNVLTKFKSDSNWYPNVVKRLEDDTYKNAFGNENLMSNLYKDLMTINKMFSEQTFNPSDKFIEEFKKSTNSIKAKMLLNATDSKDIAYSILNNHNIDLDNFYNKDLKALLNQYQNNISSIKNTLKAGELKGKSRGRNILNYNELLKREVIKEALLRDSAMGGRTTIGGYSQTLSRIKDLDVTGNDKKIVKDLLNWSILQNETSLYKSNIHNRISREFKEEQYSNIQKLFKTKRENAQEQAFLENFQNGIKQFAKENSYIFESVNKYNANILRPYQTQPYVTMRKSVNLTDMLKSLNDETKFKATAKSFIKQFYAGRDNINDVTTLTMVPFHLVNRLITPLESLGLGFSKNNKKSTGNMLLNLLLKRGLPAAALIYTYSYLNFEAQNFTGQSLSADWADAKATFNLGIKSIEDTFGFTGNKIRPMYNPIVKYWGGDHKDKDEYLDYLENGYDPVRKGRFWDFGSTSEFRGGQIQYFKPNNLRLAHSNYYDNSVYGSSDEKWKHSWIPTPRHPLAPLNRLLNPYWLEKKHYWDRPYPVTGKMFSEYTPWGVVLNPTVGAILKPQKKMHQRELGGTLTDVRTLISERNEEIRKKAAERKVGRLDSTGFTPMEFHPLSMPSLSEAVFSMKVGNNKMYSAGFLGQQYSDNLPDLTNLNTDDIAAYFNGEYSISQNKGQQNYNTSSNDGENIIKSLLFNMISSPHKNNKNVSRSTSQKMVGAINQSIFTKYENSASDGVINENTNYVNQISKDYNQKTKTDYLENMVTGDSKNDFVHSLFYSASELGGMYGFLAGEVFPGQHKYRMEGANMTSFSNRFWDKSVGGIGGDFMEIARRFFPHKDHNITEINPIRNTMPEWLPERFLTGDPYTKIPLGDARLPGRGYESLNKLHSDMYGRYGAFDRYKILGDIAPLSDEYKTWRKIARKEINNPYLIKQMDAIDERVKEQTKQHDFYDYKFIGKKMKTVEAEIKNVNNNGTFTINGDPNTYSLAGITPNKDVMPNYLKSGMVVKLQYENNKYSQRDSNGYIPAVVFHNGENITKEMWLKKDAKEKSEKETLADDYFALNKGNITMGHIYEAIGHMQIPYVHNKFLRINSPLESYRNEQIYGTPYSTWEHPIKGYLKPAFQNAWSRNAAYQAIGISTFLLSIHASESDWSIFKKTAANVAFGLTNPGGFAGAIIGFIPRMSFGSHESAFNSKNLSRIGAVVGLGGYAVTHLNNPLVSAGNFATLGALAAKQLKHEGIGTKEGAIIGAATGVILSAIKNPGFTLNKFTDKYIPKDTKKKWEIEEYYDRLEYLKYMNLYNKAARMALLKEHVNVKKIVNAFEFNREKNDKTINRIIKLKEKIQKPKDSVFSFHPFNDLMSYNTKKSLLNSLDQRITNLQTPIQYFKMGEYTKSALAYKKAADTTIYGLKEYSSTADVLRALPKYDRDYFLAFAKEKDPKKQKKILKYISPYERKALEILWGKNPSKKQESNESYFKNHELPNQFWAGWKPEIDLTNVKMKTIKNEGMLLSDMGYYDSQTQEPAYKKAPEIKNINSNNSSTAKIELQVASLLNGIGLDNLNVSVDRTNTPGIQIISNITRTATYNLQNKVSNVLGKIL